MSFGVCKFSMESLKTRTNYGFRKSSDESNQVGYNC